MTAPSSPTVPESPSKSSARDHRTSPVVGRRASRDRVADPSTDVFGFSHLPARVTAPSSTIETPTDDHAGPSTPTSQKTRLSDSGKTLKPPPPPIMLRRATVSKPADVQDEDDDGLSEGLEGLGELPKSPARGEFQRSMQSSPRSGLLASPRFQPPPSPAEQGRRIHARNLSLYFPQPGQAPADQAPSSVGEEAPVADISGKRTSGGMNGFKFGQKPPPGSLAIPADDEGASSSRPNRRGHHHKHSLSHNFFSFLDPTATNNNLGPSPASPTPWPPFSPSPTSDVPTAVPIPLLSSSSPTTLPSPYDAKNPKFAALSPGDQLALGFAIAEFFLGASLWVDGQAGGSVSVAGMGYLVVFDAIGVAVGVLGRKSRRHGETSWSTVRRPYGSLRFDTLMYFVQCLFLVFAAVYIAKESIEHVLLEGHSHSHHHSSHDNEAAHDEFDEVAYPLMLLLYSTLSAAFSGIFLSNHSRLVDAVGPILIPTFLAKWSSSSRPKTNPRLSDRIGSFLANPFSLAVSLLSAGMLVGGLVVSPSHMGTLDTSLSLLLAITTLLLSHPPTVAFGHVLLQTAPSASANQMRSLRAAVELIEADERVRGTSSLRCWRVGAGSGAPPAITRRSSLTPLGSSTSSTFSTIDPAAGPAQLVVTLVVSLAGTASDADVLSVTKMAWGRLSKAVNDGEGGGEVCVSVRRGDGASHEHPHENSHEHSHENSHEHGHEHGHEHAQSCGHSQHAHAGDHHHGHDDRHGHSEVNGHDHPHEHSTGHSHDHGSHYSHSHTHNVEDKHVD